MSLCFHFCLLVDEQACDSLASGVSLRPGCSGLLCLWEPAVDLFFKRSREESLRFSFFFFTGKPFLCVSPHTVALCLSASLGGRLPVTGSLTLTLVPARPQRGIC